MKTLAKLAVAAALAAAFVLLVPFGGLTLADRWRASDGVEDFGRGTWADMQGVPYERPAAPGRPGGRSLARSGGAARAPAHPPTEGYSAADQQALERLLGEHLGDAPRR